MKKQLSQQNIYLLRGLPGCGKSTLAATLASSCDGPVFSVDDYFTDEKGNYVFSHLDNHLAYAACQKNVDDALKSGKQHVFVANTFTMEWEMEPYFKLAGELECRIFVLTVENRHGSKNIHDIPEEQIQKMREKFAVKL